MLLLAGLFLLQTAVEPLMPLTTIARGTDSAIEEPREVVVRTIDEWRELWRAHGTEPMPEVDLSNSVVVGVFLGSRPTAGFTVAITSVTVSGDQAVVHFGEARPDPGALVAQVVTAPYHLVALPRDIRTFTFKPHEP
jgi:hypothetical protein